MSKIPVALLVSLFALTALGAESSRVDVKQLDVKPTVIAPAAVPVAAATPAPEVSATAKPTAGKKKAPRKQLHKQRSPGKAAKKSARARKHGRAP